MPAENAPPPPPPRRRSRRLLPLGLAALVLGGAWLLAVGLPDPPADARISAPLGGAPRDPGAPMQVAEGYTVGGPFALVDHTGASVNEADFAGRYMLIFFGYSFCPDVCPVELGNIAETMRVLEARTPEAAAQVVPVFVTVDPDRDTSERLQAYVAQFHPRMVGLTGSMQAVAGMVAAYRVFVHFGVDEGDGNYLVDHSAFTYLMGPDGAFVAMFRPNFDPSGVAASLARLIGERAS